VCGFTFAALGGDIGGVMSVLWCPPRHDSRWGFRCYRNPLSWGHGGECPARTLPTAHNWTE